MTITLKIIATIIFILIWGQLQSGCHQGVRTSGSVIPDGLISIFGLITLVAAIYGIWKYNPNKSSDNNNQKLDKS